MLGPQACTAEATPLAAPYGSGEEFHGRWAIQTSATCDGETVIQVLAGEN